MSMISFVGFKWVWQGQLCYPLVEGAQYGVSVLSININTPEFYGGAPADLAAATVSPFLPPARLQQMAVTLNSVTLGWDPAAGLAGAQLDYQILYEHLPTAVMYSVAIPYSATVSNMFTVTGLQNAEPYSFTVQVKTHSACQTSIHLL